MILTDSRLIISTGGPCFASVSPVLSLLVFISSTLFLVLGELWVLCKYMRALDGVPFWAALDGRGIMDKPSTLPYT